MSFRNWFSRQDEPTPPDHSTSWTAAASRSKLDDPTPIKIGRYEVEQRADGALMYYQNNYPTDENPTTRYDKVLVERDRVIALGSNPADIRDAAKIAKAHFRDRELSVVSRNDNAYVIEKSGGAGLRLRNVPAEHQQGYDRGREVYDEIAKRDAQREAEKLKSMTAPADRASAPVVVKQSGYAATPQNDGTIHYERDGGVAIVDTGSGVYVREPEDFAAAVAIAKERYGPQVETDSLDPAFLRAAHEGGLELQNLTAEQTAVYDRVKADIEREQSERAPEAVRDAQEPLQAQEHQPSDERGLPATAAAPEVFDFDKSLADDAATPKTDNVIPIHSRTIDVTVQPDPPEHDEPEQDYGYGH